MPPKRRLGIGEGPGQGGGGRQQGKGVWEGGPVGSRPYEEEASAGVVCSHRSAAAWCP